MEYPIVVTLSGPEATRAKVELALEDARLTIIPPDHYSVARQSYRAEHWPHLTPYPMVRLPDRDEYVPAPGVDTDVEHGFVCVMAANEQGFHASYAVAESCGWVLRMHGEMPPEPVPDRFVQTFNQMQQRLAELEARVGALHGV